MCSTMTSHGNSPTVSESESTDEDIRRMNYEKCTYCRRTKADVAWCMKCSAKQFKKFQWNSGNDVIDKFIRDIQARAINRHKVLEWIPYENFSDVKYLAKGGYGVVHKAKWKGGFIHYFDNKTQQWHRNGDIDVIIKSLYGSKNISRELLEVITLQLRSHDAHTNVIECYGITRDPETGDFMMVMDFMKDGCLRNFLNEKFISLRWTQKLEILSTAAKGLADIHTSKLIHKDLHPGNIVISDLTSFITDFGFRKPANYNSSDDNKIFGVLPYIAPEILYGGKYTQAADIYAFGVIINEVASVYPPYYDTSHDPHLALQVFHGDRPKIYEDVTPKLIVDLIRKCWDKKPENRPDAEELHDSLWNWYINSKLKKSHEIRDQIEKIEKSQNHERFLAAISSNNNISKTPNTSLSFSLHSGASFNSKSVDITDVLKSVKVPRDEPISDTGSVDLVIL